MTLSIPPGTQFRVYSVYLLYWYKITNSELTQLPAAGVLPFQVGQQYAVTLDLNHTYQGKSFISRAEVTVTIKRQSPGAQCACFTSFTSTKVQVLTQKAPLVAHIAGGSGTVGVSRDLRLSGIASFDPDVSKDQRSTVGLVICWSCLLGKCAGKACSSITPGTQSCTENGQYSWDNAWYYKHPTLVLKYLILATSV
jgi:hypothetical protein